MVPVGVLKRKGEYLKMLCSKYTFDLNKLVNYNRRKCIKAFTKFYSMGRNYKSYGFGYTFGNNSAPM